METRSLWSIGFGTFCTALAGVAIFAQTGSAADAPKIEEALEKHRPRFGDVEYDIPEPKTYKQCKIDVFNEGKATGWIVSGPSGQVLRKFTDTDGDGFVDHWSYFRAGLEVYRDIDLNRNNKPDQSRWLNLGGTRWGIDANEDGKIDSWKMISAEEVSRVAVRALVSQDASLLAPLLVTKDDLKELGIKGALETKLLASVADPAAKLSKSIKGSKIIQAKTTWLRFDASPPGVIPADTYKTPADLNVYENVMAIVDFGNPQQPGLVNIGELVRVGDAWKMTMLPQPLEGNASIAAGPIMFHVLGADPETSPTTNAPSPKIQELVDKLRKQLENSPPPNAPKAAFEKHYFQVEKLLIDLVNESKTEEEVAQFTRQLLDTVAAAVQSGNYPSGVKRLKELETQITTGAPKSPLVALARYRWMLASYAASMMDAKGDKDVMQKLHGGWLSDLEKFLEDYPKAEDAPDAALQIALGLEFGTKLDKAKKWYQRIVADYPDTPAATKAAGALHRMELDGKPLALSGPPLAGGPAISISQQRSKIVLVFFWDTSSKLCEADLPQIKALYDQYRAKGFEVIGVNLDPSKEGVGPYLARNQVKWPQIYEPGGLDSPLSRSFGIISLPTMFLVDADGKVTNRNATVTDVKATLEEAYSKK